MYCQTECSVVMMAIIVLVSAEREETHDCVSVSPCPWSGSHLGLACWSAWSWVITAAGHHCSLHSHVLLCVTGGLLVAAMVVLSLVVTSVTVSTHSTALINTVCQWWSVSRPSLSQSESCHQPLSLTTSPTAHHQPTPTQVWILPQTMACYSLP